MSSVSITSSKREKGVTELVEEIDAVRALNRSLRAHLQHLQNFKKNLIAVNDNYKQLAKVNTQWVETINMMKG